MTARLNRLLCVGRSSVPGRPMASPWCPRGVPQGAESSMPGDRGDILISKPFHCLGGITLLLPAGWVCHKRAGVGWATGRENGAP